MVDEDIKLMLEFQSGNINAYEEIVHRYKKPVINLIYRNIWNKEDAEDLAQEVFIRIYKAKETYKPKSKISTWIFKITSNICIDALRKHNKNKGQNINNIENEILIKNIPDTKQIPADKEMEQKKIKQTIIDAIKSLTPEQKITILLSKFQELSNEEIANILGYSVQAVKSLLHRAKLSLQEKLAPYINDYLE